VPQAFGRRKRVGVGPIIEEDFMTDIIKSSASFVGLKRLLVTTVILLNLLVYIFAGYSLFRSRLRYEQQAAISTLNLSRVLDHYIKGEINSIDRALIAVKYEAEGQIAWGGIDKESLNRGNPNACATKCKVEFPTGYNHLFY
jgi:hypothetical protein